MKADESEALQVMQLRQLLLGVIADPSRVVERAIVGFTRRDRALQRAIERGHAYDDELAEFVRVTIAGDTGVSNQAGELSLLLHQQVAEFQKERGLSAEQMIAVLAVELGRYAGFAALELIERKE